MELNSTVVSSSPVPINHAKHPPLAMVVVSHSLSRACISFGSQRRLVTYRLSDSNSIAVNSHALVDKLSEAR